MRRLNSKSAYTSYTYPDPLRRRGDVVAEDAAHEVALHLGGGAGEIRRQVALQRLVHRRRDPERVGAVAVVVGDVVLVGDGLQPHSAASGTSPPLRLRRRGHRRRRRWSGRRVVRATTSGCSSSCSPAGSGACCGGGGMAVTRWIWPRRVLTVAARRGRGILACAGAVVARVSCGGEGRGEGIERRRG